MADPLAKVVTAEDISVAMKAWVVGEIEAVGDRYFELAKFFFGVSVGSFAVIPFLANLGFSVSLRNVCDFGPFLFLAVATLSAIVMAIPISFSIDQETQIVREHRNFVRKQRFLIALWTLSWLAGIALLFTRFGVSNLSAQPTMS